MEKEINIVPPDGYQIDKDKSTFEKIVFKQINDLPKTWKELGKISCCYVNTCGGVRCVVDFPVADVWTDVYPTIELLDASKALAKLLQLRNRYNGDNKGFIFREENHIIINQWNELYKTDCSIISHSMAFRTVELRDEFYNNFKELLEIAKPLL